MNFKSSLYKSFIAIRNSHRQPYSTFTNPFGADFLLYFHFIRIRERLNINLFQKKICPWTHVTIVKEKFAKKKIKLTHNQLPLLCQVNSFGTAFMEIGRMRQQMH